MEGTLLSCEANQQRQALGYSRGGDTTKLHVLCEGAGTPRTVTGAPGQQHDVTPVDALLDHVAIGGKPGRPRTRFDALSGDQASESREPRQTLRRRRTKPVIAHRKTRQGDSPPEAAGFDKT